jgi:hypothetical protein
LLQALQLIKGGPAVAFIFGFSRELRRGVLDQPTVGSYTSKVCFVDCPLQPAAVQAPDAAKVCLGFSHFGLYLSDDTMCKSWGLFRDISRLIYPPVDDFRRQVSFVCESGRILKEPLNADRSLNSVLIKRSSVFAFAAHLIQFIRQTVPLLAVWSQLLPCPNLGTISDLG